VERIDFAHLFPAQRPIEVELGAGDGSFILRWAAMHPERNLLAVERLLGRLRKIEKKGARAGLRNLRAMRIEAGYFTEYLVPVNAVSAFHIYFPDPWPKMRHRKNRLINPRFAEVLCNALRQEGIVFLRTDDADYFQQMKNVFDANRCFESAETPDELVSVKTDFEREFNLKGIETKRAAYRKVSEPELNTEH
jgi:tRNA (guanine-N7-)-methyltransferase